MEQEQKGTLSDFATAALVKELASRPGVRRIILDSYQRQTIEFDGPVIVLEVID